jgi:hypothetical protein
VAARTLQKLKIVEDFLLTPVHYRLDASNGAFVNTILHRYFKEVTYGHLGRSVEKSRYFEIAGLLYDSGS